MGRARLRDLGITIGKLPPGQWNAITDVPGVLVGHVTLSYDEPRVARTGLPLIERLRVLYDYVILDTTSMFSELNVAMLDLSTIVTFIGIVDFIPTIKNMKIGYDTLTSIGYDQSRIRFVLNRSNAQTRLDHSDVEELLGASFYHVLSNDFTAAQHSLQTGQPLVWAAGKSGLGEELRELVARYTNRSGAAVQERSGSGWFKRIFK